MENLILIGLGIGLLFLGRKLFWFLTGAAGFLAGWYLSIHVFHVEHQNLILFIAAAAGLLGILVALLLQKIAVLVGGFLAGGYGLMALASMYSLTVSMPAILPFLVGGILGALLARIVFNWGLILLSSLAGAAVIMEVTNPSEPLRTIGMVMLFLIGAYVQWRMQRGPAKKDVDERR
jgi:hypothetical protein